MYGIILTGYEAFESDTASSWTGLNNAVVYNLPSFYHLFQRFGVYACGIAFLLSCAALMWVSGNPQKLGDAKEKLTRVCIMGVCMFGTGGIIALIYKMAF